MRTDAEPAPRAGVLLVLWLVLAVLIHHGSVGATAMAADAGPHSMAGQVRAHHGGAHDQAMACDSSTMQHCTAASVDTVTVTPPADTVVDVLFSSRAVRFLAPAGRTVARAPPDLSLLSVLRI